MIELNNATAKKLIEVYKYFDKEKGRGRRVWNQLR